MSVMTNVGGGVGVGGNVEYNETDGYIYVKHEGEWVAVYDTGLIEPIALIPLLSQDTSNIVCSFTTTTAKYKAFDRNDSTTCIPSDQTVTVGSYIGYLFNSDVIINYFDIYLDGNLDKGAWTFTVDYTEDGANWISYDYSFTTVNGTNKYIINFDSPITCRGMRLRGKGGTQYLHQQGHYWIQFASLQFYGRNL